MFLSLFPVLLVKVFLWTVLGAWAFIFDENCHRSMLLVNSQEIMMYTNTAWMPTLKSTSTTETDLSHRTKGR